MSVIRLEDLPNYTYDDYKTWEGRWELLHGVPYAKSPSPIVAHQNISDAISMELHKKLKHCLDCQKITTVDWKTDESTTVCPDNAVVCKLPSKNNYITKAPHVIFEILSPLLNIKTAQ